MPATEVLAKPELQPQTIVGYDVAQDEALQILALHDPAAAKWFYDRGFPGRGENGEMECFRFKAEEVEVVETLGHDEGGRFVVHDDMETGTIRPM